MDFLWFAIIGIVVGFLAGQIVRGRGFGLVGNLVVGVVGTFPPLREPRRRVGDGSK